MKKFLSLFLVLAMLATGLVIFSSCGDEHATDIEQVKADPYTTLLNAIRNTNNNFFIVDDDAREILEKASDKGSVTYSFEPDDDFIKEHRPVFTNMSGTMYLDSKGQVFSATSTIELEEGEKYFEQVYVDSNSITVSEEPMVDRTLKLDFGTLAKKFDNSILAEMLEEASHGDETVMAQLVDEIKELAESMGKSYEDSLKMMNEYLAIFLGDIKEETIEVDGEDYDCILIPICIDEDTAEKLLKKVASEEMAEDLKEQYINEFEEILGENTVELDLYINEDNTTFVKIVLKEVPLETIIGEEDAYITGEIFFAESRIVFSGKYVEYVNENNKYAFKINAEITKETNGDETTFEFSASYKDGKKDTKKIFNATVTYNEDSGDVSFKSKDGDDSITVTANFSVNDNSVTLAAKKVTLATKKVVTLSVDGDSEDNVYSEDINLRGLKLTVTADPKAPSAPKGATDIMDLTEEEWEELSNKFFGRSETPDTVYDDYLYLDGVYNGDYDGDYETSDYGYN